MEKKYCVMILLAAGSGSRMKSGTAKQFMLLGGKPLIWYCLHTAEASELIDECVLVTGEKDIGYMRREIVERYGFKKVSAIVAGGSERWESVARAITFLKNREGKKAEYLFVQDGARPFLTEEILARTYEAVCRSGACVASVPSKDTVRLADDTGTAKETPDRKCVRIVQTPQAFGAQLLTDAYEALCREAERNGKEAVNVTDDAGAVEHFAGHKICFAEGGYTNIKVTTPEDMVIAEALLENLRRNGFVSP